MAKRHIKKKLELGEVVEVAGRKFIIGCSGTMTPLVDLAEAVFKHCERKLGWFTETSASANRMKAFREALKEMSAEVVRRER